MAEMNGEVFSLVMVDEPTLKHLKITTGEMEAVIQEAKDAYEAS